MITSAMRVVVGAFVVSAGTIIVPSCVGCHRSRYVASASSIEMRETACEVAIIVEPFRERAHLSLLAEQSAGLSRDSDPLRGIDLVGRVPSDALPSEEPLTLNRVGASGNDTSKSTSLRAPSIIESQRSMARSRTDDQGLDTNVAPEGSFERLVLISLFLMSYISFAGLGRDIFFNHLYYQGGNGDDPIGAILPYLRIMISITMVIVVVQCAGSRWAFSKIPLWAAPFCLLAVLSALWADDSKNVIRNSSALIAMWLGLSMTIHRLGLVTVVRWSLNLISVVVIASALLAILVPSIGRHNGLELVQGTHAGRWRGIFNHKNALGPWACYGSVLFITHARLCRGPRPYWWLASASAMACLIFSGDATAIVVAIFLFWVWAGLQLLRRSKFSVVCLTMAASGVALSVVYLLFREQVFALLGRDESLTGRTDLWALALDTINGQPWLGIGYTLDGGTNFMTRVVTLYDQPIATPDNAYLSLLMDLGIVGLSVFLVPFFIVMKNGFEWMKYVEFEDRLAIEFMLMVLLSTLVQGITDGSAFICTGFDGVIAFSGFFALLTTPKSPDSRMRGEFRLAKYRVPALRQRKRVLSQ